MSNPTTVDIDLYDVKIKAEHPPSIPETLKVEAEYVGQHSADMDGYVSLTKVKLLGEHYGGDWLLDCLSHTDRAEVYRAIACEVTPDFGCHCEHDCCGHAFANTGRVIYTDPYNGSMLLEQRVGRNL